MLYSFKIVFPTRQVLFTSAVAVVKPTFHAITAEIAVRVVAKLDNLQGDGETWRGMRPNVKGDGRTGC